MTRILLCFLFLEVCFCKVSVNDEFSKNGKSLGRPLSTDDQHFRRHVRDTTGIKKFGEKGNYITTVVFVDLPAFSDSIDVPNVFDHADKFNINYSGVKFSNLSSAYCLGYRIDLSANVVQLILQLGQAQITGAYSVTTPSSTKAGSQDFVLNLYADLIYTHEVAFQVDEKRTAMFGETKNYRLHYKKVKGKYTNPPTSLAANLENYLNPNLLKAVVAKIFDEVSKKVNLNDVGYQIRSEITFRQRNELADRFKKAIANAFENVHENAYNVLYRDGTNFNVVIQGLEVRIPTFVLRDIEGYEAEEMKISFVGDQVRAKVRFVIPSPLALFRIIYRNKDDVSAKNQTVKAEFRLSNLTYEFQILANPETNVVEFEEARVKISDAKLASTQGLFGDVRDSIIRELTPYAMSFIPENSSRAFAKYVHGLLAEGRIAYQIFK